MKSKSGLVELYVGDLEKVEDKFAHARQNAEGWLESIQDMLIRHDVAVEQAYTGPDETGATEREIQESILSVQVRSGWCDPGHFNVDRRASEQLAPTPEEYEILLSTGGPALRIFGRLNQHCEPESAELQMQDWGIPWERYPAPEATLLAFASHFWFGE